MINTMVFGAGRMARCLLELAPDFPDIAFQAQVSRSQPQSQKRSHTPALDLPFFASLDEAGSELEGEIDLLIDFTLPEGTLSAAQWCRSHRVALLSGVTGIGTKVQSALDETAKSAPVLWAANFSFGINLMAGLLRELARVTAGSASITIEETHHMDKKDAPSGTALFLARHLSPPAEWETGSDPGRIAEAFPAIEFVSKREGNVVGDHSVSLDLGDETLTLAHHARDRRLYARGALEAGRWLTSQPPGRYSAADWIRGAASSGLSVSNGQG